MSTNVELERAKEQQLAATREALAAALNRLEWVCDLYSQPRGPVTEKYERRAERLLSSGVLVDADEVRREASAKVRDAVAGHHDPADCTDVPCAACEVALKLLTTEDDLADLRDAIEALAEKFDRRLFPVVDAPAQLRALVADGGADVLREVKAQALREAADEIQDMVGPMGFVEAALEVIDWLRERADDIAKEDGE